MSNAFAIAQAGQAIGQGIRDRNKNKQERAAITTRLGTLDEFKERKDEFEEMSLGDLRGLEESVLMKRAKQLEDEKAKIRAKQLEQLTQQIANQASQEQRAQASHALQMQLGGQQVGAFDANQNMAAEKHRLTMEKLAKSLEGPGDPQEILPGIYRTGLGNGNFQNLDLRGAGGIDPIQRLRNEKAAVDLDIARHRLEELKNGGGQVDPFKDYNEAQAKPIIAEIQEHQAKIAEGDNRFNWGFSSRKAAIEEGLEKLAALGVPMPQGTPVQKPATDGPQKGQVIEQGGKRYRFTGGDPKDPKNYEAL